MTDKQTISWIFLATALSAGTESTDFRGISLVADGINHAIPTHKELQTSISWLIRNELIFKRGKNYELSSKGKSEYETASNKSENLIKIWENIEVNLKRYVINGY